MCGCELSWLSCKNGASKPLRLVFNGCDISNPKDSPSHRHRQSRGLEEGPREGGSTTPDRQSLSGSHQQSWWFNEHLD
jgi:hypothetical protein